MAKRRGGLRRRRERKDTLKRLQAAPVSPDPQWRAELRRRLVTVARPADDDRG